MKAIRLFSMLLLTILSAGIANAGNTYAFSKDYNVTIRGTSNLHDWTENVETVTGEAIINLNADGSYDIDGITIRMKVYSIKSDVGSIMNHNTYKALKADDNPEIIFNLTTPVKSVIMKAGKATISAKGKLSIAGVTKTVDMQVDISLQGGKLSFSGSQKIKMTNYDVTPPKALFGTLKTGDEITIDYKTSVE
jgi:polyisoprenoid-binding protein YceI